MKFKHLLFLVPFLIGSCITNKQSVSKTSFNESKFQSVLDSIFNENTDAVGIMIHVESPNENFSWSSAVGFPEKNSRKLLQADQPALIASNTKTYVSAAVLRLQEQGKLQLNQSIENLISQKTKSLLQADGYDLNAITVVHLLSHTSGIFDYVNTDEFFARLKRNPMHHWTRDEQIALGMSDGEPQAKAGQQFAYADINYLLLTEIIEKLTGKAFFTAIAELINYKKLGLESTWFYTLEDEPKNIQPRVHQYFGEMNLDSYKMDISFDLYGGGGIASTTKDLALFSQNLFSNKIFDSSKTLALMCKKMPTQDNKKSKYYLGISESEINGVTAFGHGGFWGTVVQYFPELNASVSVFILERDKRKLRKDVLEGIVGVMQGGGN